MKRRAIRLSIAMMVTTYVLPATGQTAFASNVSAIQKGAHGKDVVNLQQELNKLGFSVGPVNGTFTLKTVQAVQAFQRAYGLPVTGVVDGLTWAVLTGVANATSFTNSKNAVIPSVPISNLRQTKVYFEKNLVASPYGFTAHGTTYMPIWYIMQVLKTVDIQCSWNGKELALTVPSSTPINLQGVNSGKGTQSISINGTVVSRVDGIVFPDPYTQKMTTYMPIWYLQQALTRLYIQSDWNGTQWSMTKQILYTAYSADGKTLGTYTSLDDAKKAIANLPGGTVKDSTGKMVYTQPTPVTYTAYAADGTVIGTYPTLDDAKNALANSPGGTVKDSTGKVVYTQPTPVTYTAYAANGTVIGTYQTLADAKSAVADSPGATVKDSNGNVVYTQPTFTAYLPSGSVAGAFASLNDAEAAIANSPGAIVKDSSGKLLYTQPIPYATYTQTGALLSIYSNLSDAKAALVNYPGGTVKDSSGTVVYTQPTAQSYTAFSPTGDVIGSFNLLSDAESALGTNPGAVVKDGSGNVVYTQPATVIYRIYQPNGIVASTVNYTSLSDAKNAVSGIQGGMVKDTSGNVLYIQPLAPAYTSYAKSGALLGLYSSLTDAKQALSNSPGGIVKDASGSVVYTQPDSGTLTPNGFKTVDLRYPAPKNVTESSIDQYLTAHGSPMAGLGQVFIYAQQTYGVDANYLVSHAILESAWGKSQIALAKDNLFGYGAYDWDPGNAAGRFPSYEYAIRFQAWEVRQNYLTPGSSLYVTPTLTGMNVHYATDQNWASGIASLMSQFASSIGDSVNSYPQYKPSNQPPAPSSSAEPAFYLNGAKAVIVASPYYGGLPYYKDWPTGNSQMFTRTLQNGCMGGDVATLQRLLNQKIKAGLTVDGAFGPKTAAALKQYQTAQGLPATGTCNFSLWNTLVSKPAGTIPAKTVVTVDEMMQGMCAGLVVEWYHIPNYGWVNSQYVQFTNAYRLTVSNPTSPSAVTVNIYDAANPSHTIYTMHAGDWVISNNPTPVNGYIQVQVVNQFTGQAMKGLVNASQVKLTAIH